MSLNKTTDEKYPVRLGDAELDEFVHGADWGWGFQLMEDDNATPIDTTGYTCEIQFRESENGELYTTLSIGSGITMTAASGLFNIRIPAATVDTYNWATAVFKVIVTDASANKKPFFIGRAKFVEI